MALCPAITQPMTKQGSTFPALPVTLGYRQ